MKKRTILIRIRILRNGWKILKSIFPPFFRPRNVFSLSKIKDRSKLIPVNSIRIKVLLKTIFSQPFGNIPIAFF
jgi:hypothetical protein